LLSVENTIVRELKMLAYEFRGKGASVMKKMAQSKFAFWATLAVAALLNTAVYVRGISDGRVGNGFSLMTEAIAAQAEPLVSPVKARGGAIRITQIPKT
jgi:hypothetical protein